MSDKMALVVGIVAGLLLVALVVFGLYIEAGFEARAYERVTGMKVSAMDAMFLELRVMEPAKVYIKEVR